MKFSFILFISLGSCIILIHLCIVCRVSSTSISQYERNSFIENSSLVDILMKVINDPEFVSLNSQQQLKVLILIYDMLLKYLQNHHHHHQHDIGEEKEARPNRMLEIISMRKWWFIFTKKHEMIHISYELNLNFNKTN